MSQKREVLGAYGRMFGEFPAPFQPHGYGVLAHYCSPNCGRPGRCDRFAQACSSKHSTNRPVFVMRYSVASLRSIDASQSACTHNPFDPRRGRKSSLTT